MSNNFKELDNLTFEQKQDLLILISSLVESTEMKEQVTYDAGDRTMKLEVMNDAL